MAVKKSASKTKRKSSGNGATNRVSTKSVTTKSVTTKKLPAIKEPLSKSGLIRTISEVTGTPKKQVVAMFDSLNLLIEKHIKSGGPGIFVLPGLAKFTVVKKPARPARKGINPFTGEEIMIKAKPASKAVKAKALKKLKEMVI